MCKTVSVGIPVYNAEPFVEAPVGSALESTPRCWRWSLWTMPGRTAAERYVLAQERPGVFFPHTEAGTQSFLIGRKLYNSSIT